MTRIVAGTARGRRLRVPPQVTRPTADRVREALFSSLETLGAVRGAAVLDLFAGSGALGLEALSRGAHSATLVDSSPVAAATITANIAAVGLPGAEVRRMTCATFLRGPVQTYDLVFIDPPYEVPAAEVAATVETLTRGWLAPEALVVVERGSRGLDLNWPSGFGQTWQRRFGDTQLLRAVWYGHEQIP